MREGVVRSCDVMVSGRAAWKALRQLMVRGMPLKDMHLRPTSRISSAAAGVDEATLCRMGRASGELSVNVAAA